MKEILACASSRATFRDKDLFFSFRRVPTIKNVQKYDSKQDHMADNNSCIDVVTVPAATIQQIWNWAVIPTLGGKFLFLLLFNFFVNSCDLHVIMSPWSSICGTNQTLTFKRQLSEQRTVVCNCTCNFIILCWSKSPSLFKFCGLGEVMIPTGGGCCYIILSSLNSLWDVQTSSLIIFWSVLTGFWV